MSSLRVGYTGLSEAIRIPVVNEYIDPTGVRVVHAGYIEICQQGSDDPSTFTYWITYADVGADGISPEVQEEARRCTPEEQQALAPRVKLVLELLGV